MKISNYFGVSIGYSIDNKKAAPTEQPLTEKQKLVLELSKQLSDDDMGKLIDYAELLKKADNQ